MNLKMDIFVEQLIKRKRRPSDFVKVGLCIVGGTVTVLLTFISLRFMGGLAALLGAGLIYLLYNLYISTNVEFEYCFTNGSLDIDKIIAAKRRKRLTELSAREIEMMGTTKNRAFNGYMQNGDIKKIYACTSIKDDGVYFVVYERGGVRNMLLFNPNDTIKDGFRRLNPQKVFLND